MIHIISYDQRSPGKTYRELHEELKRLGAKRIQASVWGVRSEQTADELYGLLLPLMDNSQDRLFVIPFDPSAVKYRNFNGANKFAEI